MGFCEAPWIEREEEHLPGRRGNGFLSDLYIFVASGGGGARAGYASIHYLGISRVLALRQSVEETPRAQAKESAEYAERTAENFVATAV